jgi:carbon monoxide dehydrogenase subunit G
MKLTATHHIKAPREKVFTAIADPTVLQKCIDGCEQLVKTADDSFDVHLKIGFAGLKGRYVGKVQIKDKKPPESYTLVLEGKGAPGFVRSTAQIRLQEQGSETDLYCEADAQVGGPIAAIGSRLMDAAAKKLTDQFFSRFAEAVAGKP